MVGFFAQHGSPGVRPSAPNVGDFASWHAGCQRVRDLSEEPRLGSPTDRHSRRDVASIVSGRRRSPITMSARDEANRIPTPSRIAIGELNSQKLTVSRGRPVNGSPDHSARTLLLVQETRVRQRVAESRGDKQRAEEMRPQSRGSLTPESMQQRTFLSSRNTSVAASSVYWSTRSSRMSVESEHVVSPTRKEEQARKGESFCKNSKAMPVNITPGPNSELESQNKLPSISGYKKQIT